jgi:hypothetical protein
MLGSFGERKPSTHLLWWFYPAADRFNDIDSRLPTVRTERSFRAFELESKLECDHVVTLQFLLHIG